MEPGELMCICHVELALRIRATDTRSQVALTPPTTTYPDILHCTAREGTQQCRPVCHHLQTL